MGRRKRACHGSIDNGNSLSNQSFVRDDDDYSEELIVGIGIVGLAYLADQLFNGSEDVTPQTVGEWDPCYHCGQTGANPDYNYLNSISAAIVSRECPDCDGKGWVPAGSGWW